MHLGHVECASRHMSYSAHLLHHMVHTYFTLWLKEKDLLHFTWRSSAVSVQCVCSKCFVIFRTSRLYPLSYSWITWFKYISIYIYKNDPHCFLQRIFGLSKPFCWGQTFLSWETCFNPLPDGALNEFLAHGAPNKSGEHVSHLCLSSKWTGCLFLATAFGFDMRCTR